MSKNVKNITEFVLLVGQKPVRAYITAVIVALKQGAKTITIKARGRSVSKAVDIAEILKRGNEPLSKMTLVGKIKIGTEEFDSNYANRKTPETGTKPRMRRVSTIEIGLILESQKAVKTE